jgi:hypothetical protein
MDDDNIQDAFDDAAGLIDETIIGPYTFTGKFQVLGFSARPGRLRDFLKSYLVRKLEKSSVHFTLADENNPVVYMLISDFPDVQGSIEKGYYRNRSCQFHIPVICTHLDSEGKAIKSTEKRGSLQVFSYGSSMQNVLTSTEVRGPFMCHAKMNWNKTWIEDLEVDARPLNLFELFPQVVDSTHEVMNKRLLSLDKTDEASDLDESATNAGGEEQTCQILKDISTVFALKQFQNGKWPGKICYQSVVQIGYELEDNKVKPPVTTSWLDNAGNKKLSTMRLRIWEYDYHPIVSALGLEVESPGSKEEKNGSVRKFDTVKPLLYLVVDSAAAKDTRKSHKFFKENLGKTLCYRTTNRGNTSGWKPAKKSGEKLSVEP